MIRARVAKHLYLSLLLLGLLPVLAWPALLFANILSLAGHRSGAESMLLESLTRIFTWGTALYPLCYFVCMVRAIGASKKDWHQDAVIWSAIPIGYVAFVVGIFALITVVA